MSVLRTRRTQFLLISRTTTRTCRPACVKTRVGCVNIHRGYPTYSTTKGKNIGANGGLYNRIGRAYPDISANGAWTHMYADGELIREGGTSMATPLVASIINLVNSQDLELYSRPPLTIYFTDQRPAPPRREIDGRFREPNILRQPAGVQRYVSSTLLVHRLLHLC